VNHVDSDCMRSHADPVGHDDRSLVTVVIRQYFAAGEHLATRWSYQIGLVVVAASSVSKWPRKIYKMVPTC
jgi:hypothetical protein